MTVTDSFGRTVGASFGPIRIDRTAPTAKFTNCPSGDILVGSAVNLTWAATDGDGSGLATDGSGNKVLDTSGPGIGSVYAPAPTDNVGNTGDMAECPFTIVDALPEDTTPPIVTYTISPALPGNNGWYNTPFTINWHVTDPESSDLTFAGCNNVFVDSADLRTDDDCQAYSAGGASDYVKLNVNYDGVAPQIDTPVLSTGRTVLALGDIDSLPTAQATDQASTDPLIRYTVGTTCLGPDTNAVGPGSVTCTAVDRAGNVGTATLDYKVTNAFLGFTTPAPGASLKAGGKATVAFRVAKGYGGAQQIANAATRVTIGASTTSCAFVTRTKVYECQVRMPSAKSPYSVKVEQNVGTSASPSWVQMANAFGVTTTANGMNITAR